MLFGWPNFANAGVRRALFVRNLIPVHIVKSQKDLCVLDLHFAETVEHFPNRFKPLLVSHRDISTPELGLLDFGEGFPVVLDDETGSQSLVVLVPQMGEGSRVVRVIGVIVRKRLSLGEVASLPGRVHLRDHLDQVTEHGADLLLRRTLPPLVKVAHHAFRVHLGHIDAEKIQALEVADLAIEILKFRLEVTISNEIDHLFIDDVCASVYLPGLGDAFLGSTLLLGLIGDGLE